MSTRSLLCACCLMVLFAGSHAEPGDAQDAPPPAFVGTWISDNVAALTALAEDGMAEEEDYAETVTILQFDTGGEWWLMQGDIAGTRCAFVQIPWSAAGDTLFQTGNTERRYAWDVDAAKSRLRLTSPQGDARLFLPLDLPLDTIGCTRDALLLLDWF